MKVWIAGEVLTASDLNAEFNNIINNTTLLISPLTSNLDFDGFSLVDLARGSASSPGLAFTGDTNTGLWSPGADQVSLTAGGATAFSVVGRVAGTTYVEFKRDAALGDRFYPALAFGGTDDGVMSISTGTIDLVAGGRRVLQASAYAGATNYFQVVPSQSNTDVIVQSAGADSNVGLIVNAKGSGTLTLGFAGTGRIDAATAFRPVALGSNTPPQHTLVRENLIGGWVTFRGKVGASIYASYNVTSVVRDSAGQYTITWDRNFAQGSAYAVLITAMQSTPGLMSGFVQSGGQSAGAVIIHTAANDATSASDADQVYVLALGPQEA